MLFNFSFTLLLALHWPNIISSFKYENNKEKYISKRAIDGSRGRKYYNPKEDGFFDNYGFDKGQYQGEKSELEIEGLINTVPGEPNVDYPAYLKVPRTSFTCVDKERGYYADEEAGCQVFHVCDNRLVSSFLCPIGSLFSQRLLTCDWWLKVPCSESRKFYFLQVRERDAILTDRQKVHQTITDSSTIPPNDNKKECKLKDQERQKSIFPPVIYKNKNNMYIGSRYQVIGHQRSKEVANDSPVVKIKTLAEKYPHSLGKPIDNGTMFKVQVESNRTRIKAPFYTPRVRVHILQNHQPTTRSVSELATEKSTNKPKEPITDQLMPVSSSTQRYYQTFQNSNILKKEHLEETTNESANYNTEYEYNDMIGKESISLMHAASEIKSDDELQSNVTTEILTEKTLILTSETTLIPGIKETTIMKHGEMVNEREITLLTQLLDETTTETTTELNLQDLTTSFSYENEITTLSRENYNTTEITTSHVFPDNDDYDMTTQKVQDYSTSTITVQLAAERQDLQNISYSEKLNYSLEEIVTTQAPSFGIISDSTVESNSPFSLTRNNTSNYFGRNESPLNDSTLNKLISNNSNESEFDKSEIPSRQSSIQSTSLLTPFIATLSSYTTYKPFEVNYNNNRGQQLFRRRRPQIIPTIPTSQIDYNVMSEENTSARTTNDSRRKQNIYSRKNLNSYNRIVSPINYGSNDNNRNYNQNYRNHGQRRKYTTTTMSTTYEGFDKNMEDQENIENQSQHLNDRPSNQNHQKNSGYVSYYSRRPSQASKYYKNKYHDEGISSGKYTDIHGEYVFQILPQKFLEPKYDEEYRDTQRENYQRYHNRGNTRVQENQTDKELEHSEDSLSPNNFGYRIQTKNQRLKSYRKVKSKPTINVEDKDLYIINTELQDKPANFLYAMTRIISSEKSQPSPLIQNVNENYENLIQLHSPRNKSRNNHNTYSIYGQYSNVNSRNKYYNNDYKKK